MTVESPVIVTTIAPEKSAKAAQPRQKNFIIGQANPGQVILAPKCPLHPKFQSEWMVLDFFSYEVLKCALKT
jgi:hypothetical protein